MKVRRFGEDKRSINCDGNECVSIDESDVPEGTDLKFDEVLLDSGECSAFAFLTDYAKQVNKKR